MLVGEARTATHSHLFHYEDGRSIGGDRHPARNRLCSMRAPCVLRACSYPLSVCRVEQVQTSLESRMVVIKGGQSFLACKSEQRAVHQEAQRSATTTVQMLIRGP